MVKASQIASHCYGLGLEWGARGPEFKSRRSDQLKKSVTKHFSECILARVTDWVTVAKALWNCVWPRIPKLLTWVRFPSPAPIHSTF
jgi:hypothetical protein